jgi:hypothetical protein
VEILTFQLEQIWVQALIDLCVGFIINSSDRTMI